MNVIAADMCTNARRVRKRWLPKIQSMLPDGMEVYQGSSVAAGVSLGISGLPLGIQLPFETDFKSLIPSGLSLYAERKEAARTHLPLDGNDPNLPPDGGEEETQAEEDEEEEAQIDSADGTLGAGAVKPRSEGMATLATPPERRQEEEFVDGLRINGQWDWRKQPSVRIHHVNKRWREESNTHRHHSWRAHNLIHVHLTFLKHWIWWHDGWSSLWNIILHLELNYIRSWDHFALNTAVNLTKTPLYTPKSRRKNKVEAFTRTYDIYISSYVYMHPKKQFIIRLIAKFDLFLSIQKWCRP